MRKEIKVHHITRIEGHGNIEINANNGRLEKVEWQVPEAPRFFESIVRGKSWQDIQTVVSRICGICSISHSLACLKGVEAAMGMEVSEQTDRLRRLAHYSELLQSHVLHIGYLVAPDLLGVKSVIPLATTHQDVVNAVVRLHRTANEWSELLAGRITHPITFKPGGFSKLPTLAELKHLGERLVNELPDLRFLIGVLAGLVDRLPNFERETEYVALVEPSQYSFYHGRIGTNFDEASVPVDQFESVVNEYVTSQSTAKWARWHRESYAVGALARYNLNGRYLTSSALEIARIFKLDEHRHNPYFNTIAQLAECAQLIEAALEILDGLLTKGIKEEALPVQPKAGEGVGCVEAPRGILFHRYIFDQNGVCTDANLSIPTNQNHGNIQKDLEILVPGILDKSEEEIRLWAEMLVRSYDPCVSCSTHYLNVKFV